MTPSHNLDIKRIRMSNLHDHNGHNHQSEHSHSKHTHGDHIGSLRQELMCHFPYAAFSLALGFTILSLIHLLTGTGYHNGVELKHSYHILFHSFHYLHLIFAVTGTCIMFFRFSKNVLAGILVSLIAPAIFCTLSDVALPALAGNILGVKMPVHICFTNFADLINLLPFMGVGLLNGWMIRQHGESSLGFISLASHFIHILISSLAALFYMISFGFTQWHNMMGILLIFLLVAVVIPCTLSDIVVPMYFARRKAKRK
jgi:hypothetical protein